jgi:hypothetical protein
MTKKIEDGGLAFPGKRMEEIGFVNIGGDIEKTFAEAEHPGMSLRDWFAGQAIPAIIRQCASDLNYRDGAETAEQYFARKAYEVADAMIAASKAGEA